ncbi:hypothetical protein IFR05_006642 [Cadophora sp. M221]|nr:hypothetical protein IFR05_006642 [Cadophora sp. M221]
MPDPMAYKHEAILLSRKLWADMGPYERAQLKAARIWWSQHEYSIPAPSAPSVPEPTVTCQPMSRFMRGSARQRARLRFPTFEGPCTTTCREYGSESRFENTQPETSTKVKDYNSGNSPEYVLSKPISEDSSASSTPSKPTETPSN